MSKTGNRDGQDVRKIQVSEYTQNRLLTYADSFKELADSLHSDLQEDTQDRQQRLSNHILREKQQMLCDNMTEVSRILSEIAAEAFQIRPFPEKQKKRIIRALRMEKIFVTDLYYMQETTEQKWQEGVATPDREGMRISPGIGINMYTSKSGGYPAAEVADMLSVLLDNRLSVSLTSPYRVAHTEQSFIFVEEPYFMVLTGYAKAVKERETVSGDNYAIIESIKGKLNVFLSDGVGSGEKACRDSEKVLDLMEKLLEAGFDVDTGMKLLNSSLAAVGEGQNMSTLDALSLNLYSGMCQFRKAGAAATFIKSRSFVEQISMHTLPLGVFPKLQAEPVTRELIENDYVIMVTDGVTDALAVGDYEEMLKSYLEDLSETNPGEMARKILQFALRCCGGHIRDDMTVVVLGIFRGR